MEDILWGDGIELEAVYEDRRAKLRFGVLVNADVGKIIVEVVVQALVVFEQRLFVKTGS